MSGPRDVLEEYVRGGKLMQVATVRPDGGPALCNVWYAAGFAPDVVRFISRRDRGHSADIRRDGRVAGSIVDIPLEGLGSTTARAVTFVGTAREVAEPEEAVEAFVRRWPRAARGLEPLRSGRGEPVTVLYEIAVSGWVLFDEENFPDQPRQEVEAA